MEKDLLAKYKGLTVGKGANGWNYQVGRFTDKLNTIADTFLMAGKKHYPNGVKIEKYAYSRIAGDLGRYCKAQGCKTTDSRVAALDELYQLCDTDKMGFTKKYWWTMGYGKPKTW